MRKLRILVAAIVAAVATPSFSVHTVQGAGAALSAAATAAGSAHVRTTLSVSWVASAHAQTPATIAFTKSSLVLLEGDSICDPSTGTTYYPHVFAQVQRYIVAHYNAGSSSTFQAPRFVNKCVSGAATGDVAGRIATELAVNPYTHVLIYLGINDAHNSVALATSQANIATIVSAVQAASSHPQLLWVGPFAWGEKWPTGQNTTVDGFIDGGSPGAWAGIDGAISTAVTAAGGVFIDARRYGYAVYEPLNNTPSPGVTVGPYTRPDTLGAHINEAGRALVTSLILPAIVLN